MTGTSRYYIWLRCVLIYYIIINLSYNSHKPNVCFHTIYTKYFCYYLTFCISSRENTKCAHCIGLWCIIHKFTFTHYALTKCRQNYFTPENERNAIKYQPNRCRKEKQNIIIDNCDPSPSVSSPLQNWICSRQENSINTNKPFSVISHWTECLVNYDYLKWCQNIVRYYADL